MATGDIFLKLEGIEGEAQDDALKNHIAIHSYSFAVSNAGTGGTNTGSGGGKASFSDMSLQKTADQSSPNLMIECAKGKHINKATLTVRKSGDKPQEYLKIIMNEVFISSYQQGGSEGGGIPSDSFSLNYSKIQFDYKPQNADGTLGALNSKTVDIKATKFT